ncbi:hypothetical protein GWI33_004267 [Rhynchophorus ferrugineus]|uniref:Uncharacterized protein n=1 Tax=Rhynchophorus ferrugineus TaxID=354439 RepID=A0A834IPQ2_RHYFE|nr:hypothetical protein GWI33_004267 [Rhynchophorus ferrugineus]
MDRKPDDNRTSRSRWTRSVVEMIVAVSRQTTGNLNRPTWRRIRLIKCKKSDKTAICPLVSALFAWESLKLRNEPTVAG